MTVKQWSVRIMRYVETVYLDLEVTADSAKNAITKAEEEARSNPDLFDEPEPEFSVDPSLDPEALD